MRQREKRQERHPESDRADCVIRQPVTPEQRAEIERAQPKRGCYQCVFYVSNAMLWLQTLFSGFPVPGMCANHSDTPGRWRDAPGRPCRNFRPKPHRVDPPEPPNDQIRYIPLTRGLHAIVDAEDYKWLSQYKWHATPSPRAGAFYARRTKGGRIMMHRLIMNPPKGMVVDHINGNGLDNRRCNLRICTPAQNCQNARRQPGAGSRFIGVCPQGDKWRISVTCNGQVHSLPLFDDEVEAAKARDRLALELHGPFARLNFPLDEETTSD